MKAPGPTAYDVAEHYDERYFDDLADRYRRRNRFARTRIANVFSLLPDVRGRRLVDLGCGMGTFAIEAARHGAAAVGVDPAPAAVRAARRVGKGTRASFVQADAAALPLANDSADVVLAADVSEHLDDDTLARILGEAARVLRAEGVLVLYTPERAHLFERLREGGLLKPDPSHIGVRSAGELADAVRRAGLDVVAARHLPSHLPIWSLLERGFARWVPLLRRRIGLVARRTTP
ncbi:MAG: class I SAM-dependent methyltransferase [Longimicrobiales bacterium]